MIIGLDYDETYTADPLLWDLFIINAIKRLHKVVFVTYRDERYKVDNEDIINSAHNLGIDIVFTGSKQKEHCFKADVWIDDSPETIPSAIKLGDMYDGCLIQNDMESII